MELPPPNRLQRVRESAFRILLVLAALVLLAGLILPAMSGSRRLPRVAEPILAAGQTNAYVLFQMPDCVTLRLMMQPSGKGNARPETRVGGWGTVRFIRAGQVVAEVRVCARAQHWNATVWLGGQGDPRLSAQALLPDSNYLVQIDLDEPIPAHWELCIEAMHRGRTPLPKPMIQPLAKL